MIRKKALTAYTISHFCVDFACFFVAFRYVLQSYDTKTCGMFFILYNIIAFGLQAIIGYFCDKNPQFPAGLVGCYIVFSSLLLPSAPALAIILAGIGNATFHVGGGIDSLKNSNGKMARSGVFVSAGALGVTLGTIYGTSEQTVLLPAALLSISITLILLFAEGKTAKLQSQSAPKYKDFNISKTTNFDIAILLACGTIFVRCFAGYGISLPWYDNSIFTLALAYGSASVLGKASGGFLADKFGGREICVPLLLISIPLLIFGNNKMAISLIGVLLFNTSMPVTLCVIYSKLKKNPGLAFGVSTVALLLGTMPQMLGVTNIINTPILLCVTIALSAVCLHFACGKSPINKGNLEE